MKNLSLLKKFLLMAGLFAVVVLMEVGALYSAASTIDQDSHQLAGRDIPMMNKAHQLKLAVVEVQQWLTDVSATRGQEIGRAHV